MNWFSYQDLLIVIMVPLMVATAIELKKNWASVWDSKLTESDRQILLKCALFLLMPAAVFLHELGHAFATIAFGGRVTEFHYGILWGYVVPAGSFNNAQILIIYLAGNVVELLLGLAVLCLAPFMRSAAVCVLFIYFGLWAVAGTIVFYPALSLVGMYGDWIAIYTSPLFNYKVIIGTVHFLLVALLLYLVYGKGPRIWFVRKIDPEWGAAYKELTSRIKKQNNAEDYLGLAWLFYEAGLSSYAQQFVTKFVSRSSHNAESKLLEGLLLQSQGKFQQAIGVLQKITADEDLPLALIARRDAALQQCREACGEK